MPGTLQMVGTPIGNLADASPRAREALASADLICCEDTRVTGKLLSLLGVPAGGRLVRCDENVIAERVPGLVGRLVDGETVAFVSDAGMPGISDPGQRLADAALDAGVRVEVVPGPSAVVCALVASGLPSDHFFFEGFLPRKAGPMARRLDELAGVPGSLVFYESPRRVAQTLAAVAEAYPGRRVALVRELTKLHEEVVRGGAAEVAELVAAREAEGGVKGECVIVVGPPCAGLSQAPAGAEAERPLADAIAEGLRAGEAPSGLAKRLARERGLKKAQVYEQVLAAQQR